MKYSAFNVISQCFLVIDNGYLDESDYHAPAASHDHLSLDVWPPCHQEVSGEAGDLDAVAVGSNHTHGDADGDVGGDADGCVDASANAIGSDLTHGDADGDVNGHADDCVDADADAIGSYHSHGCGYGCGDAGFSHVDDDSAGDGADCECYGDA